MYINNTLSSPAWQKAGSKYQVANKTIIPKTGSTYYSPTQALTSGNPQTNPVIKNQIATTTPKLPNAGTQNPVVQSNPAPSRDQQLSNIRNEALRIQGLLPPPTQQQQAPAVPPNSFTGLVTRTADAGTPSNDQAKLQRKLAEEAEKNRGIAENAQRLSEQYGSEIANIGKLGAGAVAGNLSTGTNIVGSGNAAIASQSASSRMQALGTGLDAALKGTGQQLTAQEQLQQGLTSALGSANTQQQLGISALGTAAGYAQPQVTGFGQTAFDPLSAQFGGGSAGLQPQQVASQLANAVRSGQMTYEQAVSSLGYAGGAGQQFLNQALGQGFNIPQTQANLSGQMGVLETLPQLEAADTAAEGIKSMITTYLASNPTLNPSDAALANQFKAWVEGKQLTDPKYQTLFNYLNEYTNTLAPILGVGGSPTNLKTEIAASFVNPRAGGASIAEVLNNLSTLSRNKVQNLRSGATGGGVVSSSQSYGTGGGGFAEAW